MASHEIPGPPYQPPIAMLGLVPTIIPDVPLAAVYMALFIGAAVGHMTIFQMNRRKGHKFILSGLMFGFCMARISTMVMRIVWACYPTNVRIAMAATILVAAGVILLYIVNIIFTQRILRAAHPNFAWHKAFDIGLKVLVALVIVLLVMLITAVVQAHYTLDQNILDIDRDIQLTGGTYFLFVAFLPIPLVILGLAFPHKHKMEKFGTGRWRSKVITLLIGSTLLCLGAAFRTGTLFKAPRPDTDPAWYQSKACFWVFDPTVEIITVYLYLIMRVDQRFWIPNGSKGPGDYSQKAGQVEPDASSLEEGLDDSGHRFSSNEHSPVEK